MRLSHLLTLLACILLAGPAAAEDVVLTNGDCEETFDAEGSPAIGPCGFETAQLNARGDRLVSQSALRTVQLWAADGKQLLRVAHDSGMGKVNGHVVDGDSVRIFFASGLQVEFSLEDGRELRRMVMAKTSPGFFRKAGAFHALVKREKHYWSSSEGFAILDLRTGRFVKKWKTFYPPWDHDAPWVLGNYATPNGKGGWQQHIVLNDDTFTDVAPPGWSWCHPVPERRWCANYSVHPTGISVYDVDTRKVSVIDLREKIILPNLLRWVEADGRAWPILCAGYDMSAKPIASTYLCRIFDPRNGKEVFRYQAGAHNEAGGLSADGKPEIRIAFDDGKGKWQLARINAAGKIALFQMPDSIAYVGTTSLTGEILAGKAGDALLSVFDENGKTNRKLPNKFAIGCRPYTRCTASADKRIAAILETVPSESTEEYSGQRIRWFRTNRSF
jgi:hypothetical protein